MSAVRLFVRVASAVLLLQGGGAALALTGTGPVLSAQVADPRPVEGLHRASLQARVEAEVHRALLAPTDSARDAHLDQALEASWALVRAYPGEADAWYWRSVALGLKTEFANPFQKLSTGPEVLEATVRTLELDSLHAGGHEMMGRLHAAVMRLPWPIRQLALRMGLGETLGEASWEEAERHYRIAVERDPTAVAPRLELAKLLRERDRPTEAVPFLEELTAIEADGEVDRRMLAEADSLRRELREREGR